MLEYEGDPQSTAPLDSLSLEKLLEIEQKLEYQHLLVNEHYCKALNLLKEAKSRGDTIEQHIENLNEILEGGYDTFHGDLAYYLAYAIKSKQEEEERRLKL